MSTPEANSASATHLVSLRVHQAPFGRARLGGQMRLDLPGGAGPEFGDGGDDVLGELRVGLDDVGAPAAVPVLAHPPAQQRPVVDGHQRGLVRPVLGQQPRRARAPGRAVQHVTVVGAEPAEHRRVVGAHRHRHRIQLQHLDPGDQPLQMRAGDRAAGPRAR